MKKIGFPNLWFIVMGDGPLMDRFKDQAEGLNVIFTGRLDYNQMCGVLKACDIVINPIIDTSVATIINKHADYAASGKPVINTQKSEEYRRLVNKYHMGFNCKSHDVDDLQEKLKLLIGKEELCKKIGNNVRRCAEQRFDRVSCYQVLKSVLLNSD